MSIGFWGGLASMSPVIGLFCGMVLGLQGYYTLVQFGSVGLLGSAVSLSLIRELGPVLTAIMLAGRAGSSMAAEIGVMRISDQIDALDVMDINSIAYLVSPRLVAALISFPLLTAIFGLPTPKDDIDGSQVAQVYYGEHDLPRIAVYCEKDVVATAQVFLRLNQLPGIPPENVEHR